MTLTHSGDRFECQSGYENRHIPKAAGFRWDPTAKLWWTKYTDAAAKLAQYADTAAAAQLEPPTEFTGDIPAPDGLAYLPYQIETIRFTVDHPRCLNASEMGLGKTVESIGLINALQIHQALIICPASLRIVWQRHLQTWLTEQLSIGIAIGSVWPANSDIVICNFDILGRHLEELHQSEPWPLLIIDESHALKNPKAARTRHCLGGRFKHNGEWVKVAPIPADRILMLTGTPILNRTAELWSTLSALDPERWRSWKYYVTRYCAAFQEEIYTKGKGRRKKLVWNTSGASHLEELAEILHSTVMIRKTKAQVLPELPEKRRQIIEFPANGAAGIVQAELNAWEGHQKTEELLTARATAALLADDHAGYREAVESLKEARSVAFTEMSKVRHEVAQAKLPQVIDHLGNVLESIGKLVVFAHHKDIIASIAAEFDGSVTLTGSTSMLKRQEVVDRFQDDPRCRLFVGNTKAAGLGITLTAASHVCFAELDWTPAIISQAEDRCHRIGQRNSVLIQHLVLEKSLDSKMAQMLVEKQQVINLALDAPFERMCVTCGAPGSICPNGHISGSCLDLSKPKFDEQEPLPLPAPEELDSAPPVPREEYADLTKSLVFLAERTFTGLDGQGFNRHDADLGGKLAGLETFTPRQAVLAKKLTHKYRRQLT